MKISWPTATVCIALVVAVSGAVYLERGNVDVQHALAAVLVAGLGLAAGQLPQLVRRAPPS
jgi:hypothetical protein